MKINVLIISLLISTFSFGQDTIKTQTESDLKGFEYVYLFSNVAITGETVDIRKRLLRSAILEVDDLTISSSAVKFYKNKEGFYANISHLSTANVFAIRTQKGKINLYEYVSEYYNPGSFNATTGMYQGGGYSRKKIYYYNIGFSNLKKVSYDNLSVDLKMSSDAMAHLKDYKKVQKNASISYVIGAGMIAAGFISFTNKSSNAAPGPGNEPDFGLEGALIFGGGAVCGIGYLIGLEKNNHLKSAISDFNR